MRTMKHNDDDDDDDDDDDGNNNDDVDTLKIHCILDIKTQHLLITRQ